VYITAAWTLQPSKAWLSDPLSFSWDETGLSTCTTDVDIPSSEIDWIERCLNRYRDRSDIGRRMIMYATRRPASSEWSQSDVGCKKDGDTV
jgi:hypothetical protein